jgi:hypothetical protein
VIEIRLEAAGALALDIRVPVVEPDWQTQIVTTVFGGRGDVNYSAYPPYNFIDDKVLGCALPFRFKGVRKKVLVRNCANGRQVVVEVLDIGPWNTDDEYWPRSRPLAEICFNTQKPLPSGPNRGRVPSNGAGLDLTPSAAGAIGIMGMGRCDWAFVETDIEVA